jgi:hypothetical protein
VWTVARCGRDLTPALCVDCADPCSATLHCTADGSASTSQAPLSIAPCVTQMCAASASLVSAVRLLSVTYKDFEPAPQIHAITSVAAKNSITATVQLSSRGTVYCAATPVNRASGDWMAPSSVSTILLQNFVAISDGRNASSVVLTGLSAASRYQVYCLSVAPSGTKMSLDAALQTRRTVDTLCCVAVTVQAASAVITAGTSQSNFFTVAVDARPAEAVTLQLRLLTDGVVQSTAVYPSSFALTALQQSTSTITSSKTQTLTFAASLTALAAGSYSFEVLLEGASAYQYAVNYPAGSTLRVLSTQSPLPAPQLTAATFANDGSYVSIMFDSNTDRAKLPVQFVCAALLSFPCAAAASCAWTSSRQIEAYIPAKDGCATLGSGLRMSAAVALKAPCVADVCDTFAWPNATSAVRVNITASAAAVAPTVTISAPNTIGECDALLLDLTSSSGNGGRAWSSVAISFETTATANVTDLQEFLAHKYRMSPPTAIPAALLSKGYTYNFVARLCNFLGKCGQSSKRVLVQATTIPTVTLPGASIRTTKRSTGLTIGSVASHSVCNGVPTQAGLLYKWILSANGVQDSTFLTASKDPSTLKVAPYYLQVGTVYDVTLQVTIAATLQSATASVVVLVDAGALVAVVAAGSSRSVRVSQPLTIDASTSYDEDQPSFAGRNAGLTYAWSCAQTAPLYVANCDSVFADISTSSLGGVVYLATARADAASAVAQVTLTLYDASQSRTASTVVTVAVTPSLSPVVSVTSNVAALGIVNSNRELQLTGTVSLPAGYNGTATWSTTYDGSFALSTAAKSPLLVRFAASSAVQSNNIYLVLAANTLPARAALAFTLTALTSLGTQSTAQIIVTVNAPPLPGTFAVSPRNGTEIVDRFNFLAAQWYDADLPLLYQFSYVGSSGAEISVRSKAEVAFGAASLPAGTASANYSVQCVVTVYDALFASATGRDSVTVFKRAMQDSSARTALITSTLNSGGNSVDSLKQATSLGIYLLNEVDCSQVPNCAALNRKECYRTASTCGECLSTSYVGDVGDSNTLCVSRSAAERNRRRRLDAVSTLVSCTAAIDCGAFEQCNNYVCAPIPAPCKANCSYPQGECAYMAVETGDSVTHCYVGDTTCVAVCHCTDAYVGSETCALNTTQLASKRALREQVLESVSQLIGLEDADQDTVAGWVNSVTLAAQAPDELSAGGAGTVLDMVETVLANSARAGAANDVTAKLLSAVDATLQASALTTRTLRRRLQNANAVTQATAAKLVNTTLARIEQLLAQYRSIVSENLLPGQNAVETVNSQFRSYVRKLPTSVSSGTVTVDLPRTPLEELNDQVRAGVSLPATATGTATTVAVTSRRAELFNAQLALSGYGQIYSSPLTVEANTNAVLCSGDNCKMEFTLPVANTMGDALLVHSGSEEFNTTCEVRDTSTHTHACPDNTVMSIKCNGTWALVTSRCPVTSYAPACNGVTAVGVEASRCTVKAFYADRIVCSCPIATVQSATRRLAELNTANATAFSSSYAAMLTEVKDSFISTVRTADDLNLSTIEKGWSALVTVGCLAAAVVCGLWWSQQADAAMEKVQPLGAKKLQEKKNMLSNTMDKVKGASASAGATAKPRQRAKNLPLKRASNPSVNRDVLIAEQALPVILSSNTLSHRVVTEIKHHHKWFGILFYYSAAFPRVLRVTSLATNVIIMLFIQAITYSLTNPDDGSCELLKTEVDCLAPRSPFATNTPKCFWDATAQQCGFVEPDGDVKVILFVAIFSALLCTPMALAVDWIIMNILSAPVRPVAATTVDNVTAGAEVRDVNNSVAPASRAGTGTTPRRRVAVSGDPLQSATSVVPTGVSPMPASSTSSADMVAVSRRSTVRAVFGSFVGVIGGRISSVVTDEAQLKAQTDMRKLVEELSAHRTNNLTADERVEFDGKRALCILVLL